MCYLLPIQNLFYNNVQILFINIIDNAHLIQEVSIIIKYFNLSLLEVKNLLFFVLVMSLLMLMKTSLFTLLFILFYDL